MSPPRPRLVDMLLVADSASDVELTREALKDAKIYATINVVTDGEAALAYLRRSHHEPDAARPGLVLLDMRIPRLDGLEVLAAIKADDRLCGVPVVMMTAPGAEEEIARTHEPHADCYVTSPLDETQLSKIVRAIDAFRFAVVTLSDDAH